MQFLQARLEETAAKGTLHKKKALSFAPKAKNLNFARLLSFDAMHFREASKRVHFIGNYLDMCRAFFKQQK